MGQQQPQWRRVQRRMRRRMRPIKKDAAKAGKNHDGKKGRVGRGGSIVVGAEEEEEEGEEEDEEEEDEEEDEDGEKDRLERRRAEVERNGEALNWEDNPDSFLNGFNLRRRDTAAENENHLRVNEGFDSRLPVQPFPHSSKIISQGEENVI